MDDTGVKLVQKRYCTEFKTVLTLVKIVNHVK